jgi:hypothetical protein
MDPVLVLVMAACVLVPAALAFVLRRRGARLVAAGLAGLLVLVTASLVVAARQAGGMDGLGYIVMAIGAALATGGALTGLLAGALWRRP